MIAMMDTSESLDTVQTELGCDVEQMFTPLTRRAVQRPGMPFCMDNGGFSNSFTLDGFWKMLDKHKSRKRLCRFVTIPDVVAEGRRTLEAFEFWREDDRLRGWKIALVAQDGMENLPIPWKQLDAIFIGGSTEWKLGGAAKAIIRTARMTGKWCHIGRVNSPARFEYFESLGADSIDGTGLARYSHMRAAIHDAHHAPRLFSNGESS